MKEFLDTNVLVSAFTARGLCADLFRYLLAEHEIMTGEVNMLELQRVLIERFEATSTQVASAATLLEDQSIIAKPRTASPVRVRDHDDELVLASAIAGEADMLVTGDKDLLAVAAASPVPILAPREAWKRLRGEPGAA